MWMWILIGLNIVTKVHGYASNIFPESCASMSPEHWNRVAGEYYGPQDIDPPFNISYEAGKEGEPIIVSLTSTTSTQFTGFMLEAREQGSVDEGHPVGRFILLQPEKTKFLSCGELPDSAVMQKNNQGKSSIKVKWTPNGEMLNITFRATIVQSFAIFWEQVAVNVSVTVPPPTTTTTESTITTLAPITNITSSTTSNDNGQPDLIEAAGTAMMSIDSLFVVLKMELSNIVTIVTTNPFSHCLNKALKISCGALCAAVEISSLVLFYVGDPSKVIPIALVSVIIVINFIELVIVCLPFGPSHELKEICNLAAKVCTVIHEIFTTAVMFVGILETDNYMNRKESWLLRVMAAYTAWIFLSVIWVFVFSAHRQTIIQRSKIGSSEDTERCKQRRRKKKHSAAEVTVTAVSVIFIVGTVTFTAAIIYGIFG